MGCKKTGCVIERGNSNDRVQYFIKSKKQVLDKCLDPQLENSIISYPFEAFIRMLEMFAYNRAVYSGVRVYFASFLTTVGDPGNVYIPDGQEGKLTLLFVPTKPVVSKGQTSHRDDTSNIYTIFNDVLIRLSDPNVVPPTADTASNWVRNFQKNRIPALETDGKTVMNDPGYQETHTIWYSMDSIDGDGSAEVGLTHYARCMSQTPDDPANPVDGIIVRFACFTPADNKEDGKRFLIYRLTVIFDLHQKLDPPGTAMSPGTGISLGSGKQKGIGEVDTDTGLPCPPDDGCLDNSLLPVGG